MISVKPSEESEDEIVAVITAALSEYMETEAFKIRSITPIKPQAHLGPVRSVWGFVGRLELMNRSEGLR